MTIQCPGEGAPDEGKDMLERPSQGQGLQPRGSEPTPDLEIDGPLWRREGHGPLSVMGQGKEGHLQANDRNQLRGRTPLS